MVILETILTEGISQLSYLIGDQSSHTAAVIDPRTDVDVYLELARKHGLSITHIFETHIHADFMSGSLSLADRLGTAQVYVSGEDGPYDFKAKSVRDGDSFTFGGVILTARHTPGHTSEHLAFEMAGAEEPERIRAVFTGDSLFVGSAGRPDILGDGQTETLAQQLYETLYEYYLKLEDQTIIYPGHGAGSACGADIGDWLVSTIGLERRTNKFLRFPDYEAFRAMVVDEAPPVPSHYPYLKKVNARGPACLDRLPNLPALPPAEFRRAMREPGTTTIDTRHMLAFSGGHVPGAINIGDLPELSVWIGEMIPPDQRLLLVLDNDADAEKVLRLIIRTGHIRFTGYLCGGMQAWENAGLPLVTLPQMTVQQVHEDINNGSHVQILDVRSPDEWDAGHIPTAEHHFVADMRDRITGLNKEQPVATYCASGYRASLAASLMQARGFQSVFSVPGSWEAWTAAGFPIEEKS